MPDPDSASLTWVRQMLDLREPVALVRGMRDGGSPWLLRTIDGGGIRDVVLGTSDATGIRTQQAALGYARTHGIPAPAVLGAAPSGEPPLLLTEAVAGSSAIPSGRPTRRHRTLGAVAAALHLVPAPDDPALPRRMRPIPGADFAALRRSEPQRHLLVQAERAVAVHTARALAAPIGFVHGDLWHGNTLWDGERLVALIDWDSAGYGPAGVDLGSLRCDAALCFGLDAAADVLDGWQDAAARPADDVAYWDIVAGLCTPPDMGWFPDAMAGQGRSDLTQQTLLERRDAFLQAALDSLDGLRPQ